MVSFFDRLAVMGGHIVGVGVDPDAFDLGDAGGAVRAEDEAKQLRDQVVEFFAGGGFGEGLAIGAARELMFAATRTNFAPRGFFILMASRAFALAMGLAGSTVEAAVSDESWIRGRVTHGIILLWTG